MQRFKFPFIGLCLLLLVAALVFSPTAELRGSLAVAQQGSSSPQEELQPRVPSKTLRSRARASTSARVGRQPEVDDPLARIKAVGESRGSVRLDSVKRQISEAKRQRDENPERFSEEQDHPEIPKWKSLGPTSDVFIENAVKINAVDSGRLRTLLPHPTNRDVVYLLSSGGGLWKTTNFTSAQPSWRPTTDRIGTTSGGSAALGSDPDTLYLGTGDPFDAPGGFMVTSKDGAESWSDPLILPGVSTVLDVKVDSSKKGPDVVLVGTDNGLFRSTDGGKSFSMAAPGVFGGQQVWSLVKSSAGWLASSQTNPVQLFNRTVPSIGATALYLSTNRGANWTPITNAGNGFANAGRTTLAVGAPGDSKVYAFAATIADSNLSFDQLDLFRSSDGGQTWTALNINGKTPARANGFQPDMDLMHEQAWYNQLILIDASDSARNTVYLGGNLATAKTTDGGNTWTLLSDWLPGYLTNDNLPYVHADCHAAAFSRLGGHETVFFGTDGGLFISTDGGGTWDSSKNTGLVDELLVQPHGQWSPLGGDSDRTPGSRHTFSRRAFKDLQPGLWGRRHRNGMEPG